MGRYVLDGLVVTAAAGRRRISNCGSLWASSCSHRRTCTILEKVTKKALNKGPAQPVPLALLRGEDKQPGSFRRRAQLHLSTWSPGVMQAFVRAIAAGVWVRMGERSTKGVVMSFLSLDDLRKEIRESRLEQYEEVLVSIAKPCVSLYCKVTTQEELGPTESRFGGDPHLPVGFEWPFWDGVPLTHVATIVLSQVSALGRKTLLPEKGILYFWYDAVREPSGDFRDRGGFRVDYIADEGVALARQSRPDDKAVDGQKRFNDESLRIQLRSTKYQPRRLEMWHEWTLPEESGKFIDIVVGDRFKAGSLRDDYRRLILSPRATPRRHMLLGEPDWAQGEGYFGTFAANLGVDFRDKSEANASKKERLIEQFGKGHDILSLLQLDYGMGDDPEWMWCDCGVLVFCMPASALAERDFSKV